MNQYRGPNKGWKTYPGRVKRIGVDPKGKPWVISSRKNIYEWNGKTWTNHKGPADEIAVGADGSVFVLRATKIYKFDRVNEKWIKLLGNAIQIAAGQSGKPYIIDSKQNVLWPEEPCRITFPNSLPIKDCKYDKTDWLP